jgi:hypothetical protein
MKKDSIRRRQGKGEEGRGGKRKNKTKNVKKKGRTTKEHEEKNFSQSTPRTPRKPSTCPWKNTEQAGTERKNKTKNVKKNDEAGERGNKV